MRAKCTDWNWNPSSQEELLSEPAYPPSTLFQKVFADHYILRSLLSRGLGRLFGWSNILSTPTGTMNSGTRGLVSSLKKFLSNFGVPEEISSDESPEFALSVTADFLWKLSVGHRISSAHHPQSNIRAEVAVKSAKRLLRSNIDYLKRLDNDRFLGTMVAS